MLGRGTHRAVWRFCDRCHSAAARHKGLAAQATFPRHLGCDVCGFSDGGVDPTWCVLHGFFLMSVFLLDKVKMTLQSGMSLADCSYFLKSCDGSQSDCGARIARRPYGFRA
jgi:hypothetical protein